MASTQLRSNRQLMDNTVTLAKLVDNFAQSSTWALSSDNSATLTGTGAPVNANDLVNKQYVDGLVDTSMKSPDGFVTNAGGNYPSDYKGTGFVYEGDTFYVTDTSAGTAVGSQTVNVGDLLVAVVDGPGETDASWLVVESNRDASTSTTPGVIELGTQTEVTAGTDTTRAVTPATLAGYISANDIEKEAGNGISEDASAYFNIGNADSSIQVNADDIQVQLGNTNGNSLETTATGVELLGTITGARSFTGGAFSVDSGAGLVSFKSGGTLTLEATVNNAVLTTQPTGAVELAVATTKYVEDSIVLLPTKVFNELPAVTDGSANVTLVNTPTTGTEQVYLNGARQAPGAANDYTITGVTVVFAIVLNTDDVVVVDYEY